MKQQYQSPISKVFVLQMESVMNTTSNITPTIGSGSGYEDANDALTNKKSDPFWGEQFTENGQWE